MGARARIPRWAWGLPAVPVAATVLWTASMLSTASAAVAIDSSSGHRVPVLGRLDPRVTLRLDLGPSGGEPARADPCRSDGLPTGRARETFFADKPVVSLTFDDGPSSIYTPRILDVLARYDVKATFFVLGRRVNQEPEIVARAVAEGHDIGNHSYSHPSLRTLWKEQIKSEVCRTNRAVVKAAGVRPTLFRPPFGKYAESAVPLLGGLGMSIVLWSVDGADWETDDPDALARSIVRQAEPGSIILLHDRESVTVRALPAIIRGLRAKGLAIEPVSAALLHREPGL